jgi:MFS family permease
VAAVVDPVVELPRLDETPARRTWGPYGKAPLVALAVVGLVEGIERRVLPAVLSLVQDDLGFSDFQAGLLDTAIIVAALLVAIPAGVLADRVDRRRFIAGTFVVWSALVAVTGSVRSYGQLLGMRVLLGAGDAINDPAGQSLLADCYPPERRGRVYGIHRVTPVVGAALGLGLGATLGSLFGWRVAVAALAVPGLLAALLVARLREPARGASDVAAARVPDDLPVREALRRVLAVPSLRALVLATALTSGALSAIAFWGVVYFQRAAGLGLAEAGAIAGVPVLFGALAGSLAGGWLVDRLRARVAGAALLVAAVFTSTGALLFTLSFLDGVSLLARLPMQGLSVGLLVGSLPATTVLTSEVVPPALRGTAFGVLKLSSNALAALFPPVVGLIADLNQVVAADGVLRGDLGLGFRCTLPTILIASALLLRGRCHVARDTLVASGVDPSTLPPSVPERIPPSWQLTATVALVGLALLALALLV